MAEDKRINVAYRLHTLLAAAAAHSPQTTEIQVLAQVFKVQHLSGRPLKQAVAKGVELIFEQLDRMVEQLQSLHHPKDSYNEIVTTIDSVLAPEYLNHPWQENRIRLEKILLPLNIMANWLPDEEKLIGNTEFETICEELNKLEQSLADKGVSPEVRIFVKRQIDVIQKAIWEYKFRGARSFENAMVETFRDYANSNITVEHENDPPMQKVAHIWKRIKQIMDTTIKTQGALNAVQKIYQLAENAGLHHHLK
jgi:hypothetical protein